MNWYIWTPVLCCACWSLGLLMGLSLGFRVGTNRTIMLFTRHFPTQKTMTDLVRLLFRASDQLLKATPPNEKPDGTKGR